MRKLKSENINQILFLDIETAPSWEKLEDAPENVRDEWIYKFKYNEKAPPKPDVNENANYADPIYKQKYFDFFAKLWEKQAGLYPEFSRVICISAGFFYGSQFRCKSYYDTNEGDLLDRFCTDWDLFKQHNKYAKMCAHYGKGFDFPYMAKRLLIHRRAIPFILDNLGAKPWEMESLLDTQEIWKNGYFASSGTLSSIAMSFGLPSPKGDIDGGDVSRCYHGGEINRIVTYCEKDIVSLANVFKCMRGEEPIKEENIVNTVL